MKGSVKSYMKTGKSNTLTGKNSNGGKRYRGWGWRYKRKHDNTLVIDILPFEF